MALPPRIKSPHEAEGPTLFWPMVVFVGVGILWIVVANS